jgi:hypothetical protein
MEFSPKTKFSTPLEGSSTVFPAMIEYIWIYQEKKTGKQHVLWQKYVSVLLDKAPKIADSSCIIE